MELQQRTQPARGADTPESPDTGTISQTLAACRRLADASDAAIERVLSGDAEVFIAANQQSGGQ